MADAGNDWRDAVAAQQRDISDVRTTIHDVKHDLATHRQIVEYQFQLLTTKVEDRHNKLAENFSELKNALKWGLGLLVSVVMSFMSWAVLQQYNANESQKKDMQQQIGLLQAQEQSRRDYRAEVLARLPPGGSEPAGASQSGVQH